MGESLVGHIPNKENIADSVTKVFYGHKRRYLVSNIFLMYMMTISYQL